MTQKQHLSEKEYMIRLVQSRFELLQLTPEQAEKIHDYEQNVEGAQLSNGNFASIWEEKEIETHYFKEILDENQFILYRQLVSEQIGGHEQALAEEDINAVREVNYAIKILQHYKDEVVPPLLEHRKNLDDRSGSYRRKLDYLKEEYHLFLKSRWKEVCVMHFRHSRNLQPNKFRAEQLAHELEKTYPTWFLFEPSADEATKAVARSLVSDLSYDLEQYNEFVRNNRGKQQRAEEIFQEFYSNNRKPVIVLGRDRPEQKQLEDGFLSYLLIDPERYA